MDLVVEDENEGTTGSSDDVRETSLEESSWTFLSEDLVEAIESTVVKLISTSLSGGHHESTSDGIKWIRGDTSSNSDNLSESPLGKEWSLLVVFEELDLSGIVKTEVGSSVHNDTNNGDTETVIEGTDSTVTGSLGETVDETSEFSFSSGTNISSESGSCEIKWVDEAEGSCSSGTTGSAVTNEEFSWVSLWVVWAESLLVEIFACEVEGLSWEITDNVGKISSPEGGDTLLGNNSLEAVTDTIVSVFWSDVLVSILNLKKKLDSLDWGNNCL